MRQRRFTLASALLAAVSLALIAVSIYQIQAQGRGIVRESVAVGTTPVEIFRPAGDSASPAVMVAHGFSGSSQIMYAFGYTLAHNGYLAALVDFPGHGRNLVPLRSGGSMSDVTQLDETLVSVADYLRTRTDISPAERVATLGHSMGTAAVISYGTNHPDVNATVAVSDIVSDVTPTLPHNLRLLTGALEFANLKQTALAALQNGGGQGPGQLYGNFANGTARELDFVPGSEHVTILFNRQALAWSVDWLNQVFGRTSSGWTDSRMIWVLALYIGALILFFPLSQWVWRRHGRLRGHRVRVGELLLFVGLPALLTPLLLWLVSPLTTLIPILVANYQAVYFLVAGLFTLLLLWWTGHLERRIWRGWLRGGGVVAGVLIFGYLLATLFIPGDLTWASLVPRGQRVGWFFLFAVLCFPYFLADTSLNYGQGRGQSLWRFLLTKGLFLGSMLLAIQLMPSLFFMMLLLPFLLLAWALFAAYSTRVTGRLGTPVPGAVAMTLAFAWFMASLFPLV